MTTLIAFPIEVEFYLIFFFGKGVLSDFSSSEKGKKNCDGRIHKLKDLFVLEMIMGFSPTNPKIAFVNLVLQARQRATGWHVVSQDMFLFCRRPFLAVSLPLELIP